MEVHSHGQETLRMNKEADKVYKPEFKDNLGRPSSQIPEGENFTVAPATDFDHSENEIMNNFPQPTSGHEMDQIAEEEVALDDMVAEQTSGCEMCQGADQEETFDDMVILEDGMEQTSGCEMDQIAEQGVALDDMVAEQEEALDDMSAGQEESFDDMVVLEDGMMTSATIQDVQIDEFQQVPLTDTILPTADISDNTANLNFDDANGTMEDGIQYHSAHVSEVPQHATVVVAASPTEATDAAYPAMEPSGLPLDSDQPGEITVEQSPDSDPAKVKLLESTEGANVSADNDHSRNVTLQKVVTEEDICKMKGQKVIKKFGRKNFAGEVVNYDPDNNWFKVVYEDGDEEELELSEVKLIVASSNNNVAPSSKKRPRAEGGTDESATKSSKKAKKTGAESSVKMRRKSVSKSSAKSPGKGSKSALKRGKNPGQMTKKAQDPSAFKTPDSSEGTKGKGQKTIGTSTSKNSKRGASRKRKSIKKVSRSLDLQTPKTEGKGKSKASPESSGTKIAGKSPAKAEDTPWQTPSYAKPEGLETTRSTKTKRLKKGAATGSPKVEEAMHVGKHVKKDFDGTFYNGIVMKYNKKTHYYKVEYEDGDQEDLELHELEPILVQETGSVEDEEKAEPTAKRSSLSALMSKGTKAATT